MGLYVYCRCGVAVFSVLKRESMVRILILLTSLAFFSFTNLDYTINSKVNSKAYRQLSKYYGHEVLLSRQYDINNGVLYKIDGKRDRVFIGVSRSKFEDFHYMCILDEQKRISLVRILIYRENYGGEIGSHRWLRQFIGQTRPKFMIDAISGATISVISIQTSINNLTIQLNDK